MDSYQPAPSASSEQGPGRRFFIVDEDPLRQKILELSPEIRRDTQHMEDIIAELVKLERETRGLDRPQGLIELKENRQKTKASDPDFIGSAQVAGRNYHAAAWAWGKEKIRVALSRRA
jgi:hypothetical protein